MNQLLSAENDGAVSGVYGVGALMVTVRVPRGSVRGVTRLEGFDTFETLCETSERASATLQRGACRRGASRGARLARGGARERGAELRGRGAGALEARVAARRDNGRVWERVVSVSTEGAEGR